MKLIFRRCDTDMLTQLLPGWLHLERGSWVAGGAARCLWFNQPQHIANESSHTYKHDIDVFCQQEDQRHGIKAYIERKWFPKGWQDYNTIDFSVSLQYTANVIKTANATTYVGCENQGKYTNIQVINQLRGSLQELFASFDFHNCQFATNGIWIVATEPAVNSWQENTISRNPEYAGEIKIARILKYCIYGLNPPQDMWQELVTKSLATRKAGWNYDYTA